MINASKNSQISPNDNKPIRPFNTRRAKLIRIKIPNANVSARNANSVNTNLNENTSAPKNKSEIMNERIEIAPKSNYALPFKITDETAKIFGKVEVLEGEKIKGFVYFQKMFDEHFPDEIYKVFSFDGAKEIDVNQTLIKENYVLVFVNDSEKPVVIRGKFSVRLIF